MRYLELFAGAGGLSMGLEAAGMVPVAHAEIEPNARAVLRYRWPDTDLLSDVVAITGGRRMKAWMRSRYGGVDVVAGGSPCQDLSVAGKRAGLGGARSGLFHQQARIWEESGAPYLIWENVVGALSSQNGRDFAIVLSTLVGATIPVPADGWRTAGVAAGATGVAAWRVFDLQHFGPPRRRRRVFIVAARAGGCDPAEILALSEGVCGHPAPRDVAREDAATGFDARLVNGCVGALETRPQRAGAHEAAQGHVLAFKPSHYTRGKDGAELVLNDQGGRVISVQAGITATLRAATHGNEQIVFSADADKGDQEALAFHRKQDPISGPVAPALGGTTDGMGIVTPTLSMGAHTAAPGSNGQDAAQWAGITHQHSGRPRRLTPKECERLMGWPDGWTATGTREDGTTYALSDSARYRLCGNGVGAPVAEWIGRQLVAHDAALRQEAAA